MRESQSLVVILQFMHKIFGIKVEENTIISQAMCFEEVLTCGTITEPIVLTFSAAVMWL